jgi:ABC-type transport system involved in multi-copper enzyme maturation permease subunit
MKTTNKPFILAGQALKELIRKKDFYVLLILFIGLAAFFYNESFFGVEGISRYLKEIGFSLLTLFSMIIVVTFSARQIPVELEGKTIYPLLAKPLSRGHFVMGKFAGSLFISVITFSLFYFLYLAIIFAKGEGAGLWLAVQSYVLSIFLLAFLSSIAIFFSLFFTVSANVTMVFTLYFFMYWYNGTVREILLSSEKASRIWHVLYYILPHFEFFDTRIRLVHMWDPLPLWAVAAVSIYAILYIALILWATSAFFKRKSL